MIKISTFLLCILISSPVLAAKPDWPGRDGMGIIGFGLVELEPGKTGSKFRFTYEIPDKYAGQLDSAQMIILPASALEKYNDIPASALITRVSGKQHLVGKPINLSTEVTIDKPGLYVVAYGPWDGLLTFDNVKGTENYKISAEAVGDAQLKWIDQDAGDFTIVDLSNVKGKEIGEFHMRLRIVRDRANSLTNKSFSKYGPLILNKTAKKRVELIDATW